MKNPISTSNSMTGEMSCAAAQFELTGHVTTPAVTHRLVAVRHCSTETTVTDLGGKVKTSLPPSAFAEIAFGTTVFGASKVLTLSTFGAVSVSPTADLAAMPVTLASISTD